MSVFWITGLSGAGKTTLSNALVEKLKAKNLKPIQLDGDLVRKTLSKDLGYSEEDRRLHILRIQLLSEMLSKQGFIVIVSALYFDGSIAEVNRKTFPNYCEIFINSELEFLYKRNQKDIYRKFKKNEISNVVGLDIEYESPKNADLIFLAEKQVNPCEMANAVLDKVKDWF